MSSFRYSHRGNRRAQKTAAVGLVFLTALFISTLGIPAYAADKKPAAKRSVDPGAFSLVDHRGRAVTNKTYRGKYMLVFFGYTHCPDVCPTDLQVMSDTVDLLGAAGKKVQPIFITIDPERDKVKVLAAYVANFHKRLTGLTGTKVQVAAAAKKYGVRYRRYFPPDGAAYLMDHSAAMYLIGPGGKGISRYPHGMTAKDIAADIKPRLK